MNRLAASGAAIAVLVPIAVTSLGRDTETPQDPVSGRVRLRISGHLEGRLEPCGCASGQLGGLARRSFRLLQDRNYDVLIEGGGLVPDGGPLSIEKLFTTAMVLEREPARYHALGLDATDLELPFDYLSYLADSPLQVVTSDLEYRGEGRWPGIAFVERDVDGTKIRIASLTRAKPKAGAEKFRLLDPADAWKRALEGSEATTLRVLMVHGDQDDARAQARLEPRPDLIIAANAFHTDPPREADLVDGVPLVNTGTRGRFLLDVTLTRTAGQPRIVHYAASGLSGSKTARGAMEDADVRSLLLQHRELVKEQGIREQEARQRETATGARYVGNAVCAGCHIECNESWKQTKHATAWQTLVDAENDPDRYGWPVTHYPDCVGCHTVGYREKTGFVSPEATPMLLNVGCEACHGPGSKHLTGPKQNPLGKVPVAVCQRCHDFEQSPEFDWNERWKKIEHELDSHLK